jgi:uncharacterized protein YmfQ (DUF2313 family)
MAEVTRKIFDAPDIDGTANELASALPQGRVWEAKNSDGTNMRALVGGAAMPFNIAEQKVEDLASEFDINQTTALLSEWEESVGLPDECFAGPGTIEERRAAIIERFRRIPVVTIAEMQAAVDALFPDVDIELRTGTDYYAFECEFEIPLFGTEYEKFVIVARVPVQVPFFEYDLELEMTGALNLDEFRCYMEKIIPANVYLMIEEINPNA